MSPKPDRIAKGVRVRTYKSGLRRIEIQFQYEGTTCKEVLAELEPDSASGRKYAVNLKSAIELAIRRGTFDYVEYFPKSPRANLFRRTSTLTVQDAQEGLLQDLATAGIEQTTLHSYRKSAKRINASIGKDRVIELTPERLRQMVRERPASRKTWNNDLIPLRRALNRAVNDGLIPFSPLDRIVLDELIPKFKKPVPDPFTMEEIAAILTAAGQVDERTVNTYEFALFTGVRLQELVALSWDTVDLNAGTAAIVGAGKLSMRSAEQKGPKTEAGARVLQLLPRALEAIKRQRTVTWFRQQNVFCQWHSLEPFRTYQQLNKRWRVILKVAGVRYRPMKQTRHTYASHQLSSGVNAQYVAQQMGHKGTSLLEVYGTWVDDWKEEHQERKYGS